MAAALRDPVPVIKQGLYGVGGLFATLAVGNMVTSSVMPTALLASDMTSRLTRLGIRGGVAYGLDMALRKALDGQDLEAFRVGTVIALVGSAIFDFLGVPLLLGRGDAAVTFNYAFRGLTTPAVPVLPEGALTGTGSYMRAIPGAAVGATGAYIPTRSLRGVGRVPRMFGG